MKKRLICLLLCMVMLLVPVLTACSGGEGEGTSKVPDNALTLTMWVVSEEDVDDDVAKEVNDAINNLTRAKYKTELEIHYFTPDEYRQKMDELLTSAEEAKAMMDEQPEAVILDVREQHEYDEQHIPGAVLLPVGSIDEESAAAVIPGKDTVVLVYCRSGNRSKTASGALAELGYTAVYEFGGINSWPYETES